MFWGIGDRQRIFQIYQKPLHKSGAQPNLIWSGGFSQREQQGHSKLSTISFLNMYRPTQPLGAFFSINQLFHWSKAKGNGNGGRLSTCLMVWKAASDWSISLFSLTTREGKKKLWKVAWAVHIISITSCVLMETLLNAWYTFAHLRQQPHSSKAYWPLSQHVGGSGHCWRWRWWWWWIDYHHDDIHKHLKLIDHYLSPKIGLFVWCRV